MPEDTIQTIRVSVHSSGRGQLFTAQMGDRSTNVLVSTAELREIEGAAELNSALITIAEQVEHNAKRFLGAELEGRLLDVFRRTLGPALAAYLKNATALKARVERELADFATPPSVDEPEAIIRASIREGIKNVDPSKLAEIISQRDMRTLAAILEVPAFVSGLNDQIYEALADLYRLNRVAEKFGLVANHAKKSSLDNPIVTGFDRDAVDRDAREIVKKRQAVLDAIELAAQTIQRSATLAALITAKTVEEIFREVAPA